MVLAIGRPIGDRCPPRRHARARRPDRRLRRPVHVPQLDDRRRRARSASSSGSASPPHRALIARPGVAAGVDEQPPGRGRRLHDGRAAHGRAAPRAPADPRPSRSGRSPPARPSSAADSSSSPAMSNDRVVTATSTSLRRSARAAPLIEVRKLTSARCGICTPFGLPGRARGVDDVGQLVGVAR